MNRFSERLREVLKANNMSQSELARRINKSHDSVSCYCSGKANPTLDVFVLICTVLDESADYLLGLVD